MKNIIITAGPTVEFIDNVRIITNISSGKTAKIISEKLSQKNKIFYLYSKFVRHFPRKSKNIKSIEFDSFKSLNSTIKKLLSSLKIDAVIHLAAVSDYSPKYLIIGKKKYKLPIRKKISSNNPQITIIFKKNFKIIDRLKKYSKNKKIKIIGFKLTSNASQDEIIKAVKKLHADIVIHNDTSEISKSSHIFRVFKNNKLVKKLSNEKELSLYLEKTLEEL